MRQQVTGHSKQLNQQSLVTGQADLLMQQTWFHLNFLQRLRTSTVVLLLIVLAGCSASTITLDSSYPAPLTRSLPLTLGVYYSPEFSDYTYTEINDENGKDQYIIATGTTQVELFNTLLPAMFDHVVLLDSPEDVPAGVDAVFMPGINVFQLGLPNKTKLNVFEIWMEYQMRLTRPDGEYIADWKMTAYGKTSTESFQSVEAGVQEASNVAMRDLAASFTLGFNNQPDVNDWLKDNNLLSN